MEGLLMAAVRRDSAIWREIYAPILAALWRARHELGRVRQAIHSQRRISYGKFFSLVRPLPRKFEMLVRYGLPRVE
jgi:hypothetical protein